jgi:hypothetical protein
MPTTSMQTIRIRIIGAETCAETLMNMIHEMDGVAQVKEMLLPDLDQRTAFRFEVGVIDAGTAWRIRTFTAGAAMLMDASAEFAD